MYMNKKTFEELVGKMKLHCAVDLDELFNLFEEFDEASDQEEAQYIHDKLSEVICSIDGDIQGYIAKNIGPYYDESGEVLAELIGFDLMKRLEFFEDHVVIASLEDIERYKRRGLV